MDTIQERIDKWGSGLPEGWMVWTIPWKSADWLIIDGTPAGIAIYVSPEGCEVHLLSQGPAAVPMGQTLWIAEAVMLVNDRADMMQMVKATGSLQKEAIELQLA